MTVLTFPLFYVLAFGKPQAIISEDAAKEMENNQEQSKEEPRLRRPVSKKKLVSRSLSSSDENSTSMQQSNTCNINIYMN